MHRRLSSRASLQFISASIQSPDLTERSAQSVNVSLVSWQANRCDWRALAEWQRDWLFRTGRIRFPSTNIALASSSGTCWGSVETLSLPGDRSLTALDRSPWLDPRTTHPSRRRASSSTFTASVQSLTARNISFAPSMFFRTCPWTTTACMWAKKWIVDQFWYSVVSREMPVDRWCLKYAQNPTHVTTTHSHICLIYDPPQ